MSNFDYNQQQYSVAELDDEKAEKQNKQLTLHELTADVVDLRATVTLQGAMHAAHGET